MKLSEMSNEECFEKLVGITPLLSKITEDEEMVKIFLDRVSVDGMDKNEAKIKGLAKGLSNTFKLISKVFDKHKEEVYGILSIVNDLTIEEVRKQNVLVTIKQFKELWEDKELLNF